MLVQRWSAGQPVPAVGLQGGKHGASVMQPPCGPVASSPEIRRSPLAYAHAACWK